MNPNFLHTHPPVSISIDSATVEPMTREHQPDLFVVGADDGWKGFLLPTSPTLTVRELGDAQLEQLRRDGRPWMKLAGIYSNHLYPAFGPSVLAELETAFFIAWAKYLVTKPPRGKGLRRSTVSKILARVKALFELAVSNKTIAFNPARLPRGTLPPKLAVDELEHASVILSITEIRRILFDHRVQLPRRALRGLLLFSGMRIGELGALAWSAIRPSPTGKGLRMLVVQRAIDSESGLINAKTKTGGILYVPIHPRLDELLEQLCGWWRSTFGREPTADDLVIPRVARRRRPAPRLRQKELEAWKRDLVMLGIAPRTLHKTRHTFISRLKAAGADTAVTRRFTHWSRKKGEDDGAFGVYNAYDWELRCRELLKLEIAPPASQLDLFT